MPLLNLLLCHQTHLFVAHPALAAKSVASPSSAASLCSSSLCLPLSRGLPLLQAHVFVGPCSVIPISACLNDALITCSC
eukprot:1158308-Pelagomonas_calceolata.AAC.8